jgi:hypothetical protein
MRIWPAVLASMCLAGCWRVVEETHYESVEPGGTSRIVVRFRPVVSDGVSEIHLFQGTTKHCIYCEGKDSLPSFTHAAWSRQEATILFCDDLQGPIVMRVNLPAAGSRRITAIPPELENSIRRHYSRALEGSGGSELPIQEWACGDDGARAFRERTAHTAH